jgi:hypothetical protein
VIVAAWERSRRVRESRDSPTGVTLMRRWMIDGDDVKRAKPETMCGMLNALA